MFLVSFRIFFSKMLLKFLCPFSQTSRLNFHSVGFCHPINIFLILSFFVCHHGVDVCMPVPPSDTCMVCVVFDRRGYLRGLEWQQWNYVFMFSLLFVYGRGKSYTSMLMIPDVKIKITHIYPIALTDRALHL